MWVLHTNWDQVPLGLTCVYGAATEDYFIRHFFKSRRLEKNAQERMCMLLRKICKSAAQFNGS